MLTKGLGKKGPRKQALITGIRDRDRDEKEPKGYSNVCSGKFKIWPKLVKPN